MEIIQLDKKLHANSPKPNSSPKSAREVKIIHFQEEKKNIRSSCGIKPSTFSITRSLAKSR